MSLKHPHVQAEEVGVGDVLPALGLILAIGHEEEVATQGDGGGILDPRIGSMGSLPREAIVDDVVGLVPLVVAGPDPAVGQRKQLCVE